MKCAPVQLSFPSFRRRFRRGIGLCVLALALAGTAHAEEAGFRHEYLMRGHILEADAGVLVVCVGATDGAQVGQELDVVSHERVTGTSKRAGPRYRRETVGRVRITSLFDEHYATAEIVEGNASPHDTVELTR
jgi:hypothetical protein